MTVGIYIRVSTHEQAQEGYSIAAQKERLISYCQAQGWDSYKIYAEEGVSAKDTNRPKLQLLLDDVKTHKIDMILVYRLDRFTRSVADLYKMLSFLEENNCAFKSATEIYDTSSAMGRMFIGLVALLAQWETENLSERIKMALDKKVSDGEHVGNILYGFKLGENEKLVKSNEGINLMAMIERAEKGWSLNRIARYMNSTDSNRTWQAKTVDRILKNPALYGATRWKEKTFENTHEGYISKDRFLRLQQMLKDRGLNIRKDIKHTVVYQGVLSCPDCGHKMGSNRFLHKRKDGSDSVGNVYRCRNCQKSKGKAKSYGERYFEEGLIEYMKNLTFEGMNLDAKEENIDESSRLNKQLEQIERKREKYQRAWAADLISDSEFEERMNETKEIYLALKDQLNLQEKTETVNTEMLKEIVFTFNQCYKLLSVSEKRDFIQRFIRNIDFEIKSRPPKNYRSKKGRPQIVVTNIDFY